MASEKTNKLRAAAIITMMIIGAAIVTASAFILHHDPHHARLLTHWTVETKDGVTEDITLEDANFGTLAFGDTVVLTHVLPNEKVWNPCIQIRTIHASVRAFTDDALIYEDGASYTAQRLMTPSYFHFIPLGNDYAGKLLRLEIRAENAGAFSGMEPVFFGDINDLYTSYSHQMRFTLLAALFLVVTGVVLLFIFFFLWNYYKREMRVLFSALISLSLGVYILCYNDLPDFVIQSSTFYDIMEYLTLYTLPCIMIAFLGSIQENASKNVYTAMIAFDIGLVLYIFVLYGFRIVLINRFVTIIHLVLLSQGATVMILSLLRHRPPDRDKTQREAWRISEKVLVFCFMILVILGMLEVGRYTLMRFLGFTEKTYISLSFLTAGAAVFVVGLFLNFFYYHIERVNDSEMMKRLSGLAYTDPLTGMANRSRCEKILESMDVSASPSTVLSMDVDHLKRINDTWGHATGDQYLVDMAEILRMTFPEATLLGRMGGDEFLVVMPGTLRDVCAACTAALDKAVYEKNATSEKIDYGISYGSAFTDETGAATIQSAIALADERMYAMKKARRAKEGRA